MADENPISAMVPLPLNGGRQLVIGDVHGCFRTLGALLQKLNITKHDQVFMLGDLIDRGPSSSKVLDIILGLEERGFSVYCLRGNHEQLVLDAAEKGNGVLVEVCTERNSLDLVRRKGGLKKRYKRFLQRTFFYLELNSFYLVHAGFNMKKKNRFSDLNAMLWKRPFHLKKKLNGKRVIYGHNPRRWQDIKQAVDMKLPHIGLDNGCVHTHLSAKYGRLVCLELGNRTLHKVRNGE